MITTSYQWNSLFHIIILFLYAETFCIYDDKGVWPVDVGFITSALRASRPQCKVLTVNADQIRAGVLDSTVDCFFVPGGADVPYHESLGQSGMNLIKAYVRNGGKYLGLCAGGYLGSKNEFFNSGPLPIIETGLGLFDGCDEGPVFPPYNGTDQTARMIDIKFYGYPMPVYYNGGGQFVSETNPDLTKTVASYTDNKKSRAVVQCEYGQGLAVLTGVHPELCYAQCLAHLSVEGRKKYEQQLSALYDLEQRYGKYYLFKKLLASLGLQTAKPKKTVDLEEKEDRDCCEWLCRIFTNPFSLFEVLKQDYDMQDTTETPSCTLPAGV